MPRDTHTCLFEYPLPPLLPPHTPRAQWRPCAARLHPPHLSRALASSGVLFPLRSLRRTSPAKRRARRAPRPPRRSAMARAKPRASVHQTAPGPRGPPGSAQLQRNAFSGPPPWANSGPARSQCGLGTDPDATLAPGQGVRSAGAAPPEPPPTAAQAMLSVRSALLLQASRGARGTPGAGSPQTDLARGGRGKRNLGLAGVGRQG